MNEPAYGRKFWYWAMLVIASLPQAAAGEPLDLGLEPPRLNTNPGPEYADDVRSGNMIIGVERSPRGRLWCCWVGNGDNPNGFFMLATSDDQGATWSKPRLVIDPSDPPNAPTRRALVGNLWTDPQGRLWLFFDQSLGYFDGRAGDWYTRCDNPDDEQPVWSEPVRFADGCTLNKPTVLTSGEWLIPVSLWPRERIAPDALRGEHHELDGLRMANVFASTDQGRTWSRRGGVRIPGSEFDEHMIVEKRDGRLWLLARTRSDIWQSFSSDRGRTWSKPTPSGICNPSARFFIRRLTSGKLLLVKNGPVDLRLNRRSDLTAFLSDDDGATWHGGLLIDGRAQVTYPDGFEAPDGTICIAYDWNRHREAQILLAQFREADVAAGAFVSPGARTRMIVNIASGRKRVPPAIQPDEHWAKQAAADARLDRTTVAYDGVKPNSMVCDTTLRELPDGSWALFFLAGGDFEPSPENYTALTRSTDEGRTWSRIEPVNLGLPRSGSTIGQGPTELLVRGKRCTLFFSTHAQTWGSGWRSWLITSDDNGHTWSKPEPLPGRLAERTFIRNHIVLEDGTILLPFQHYLGPLESTPPPPASDTKPWHKTIHHFVSNPRNGVLISRDGATWSEHGDIQLTPDRRYHGWAENNIVEIRKNRIAMFIRGDRLGGWLWRADSSDGGRTWPEMARRTDIPNPGSKFTLYKLAGGRIAMLHNPNPSHRSPLALWISFDGMKTWPYQRVLVAQSSDGPKGRLNYPDGFVSGDGGYLHFAYDDNRHRAVVYSAKLPPADAHRGADFHDAD